MTARSSAELVAMVEKMATKIEAHEVPQFTYDEAVALRSMIAFYRTMEGLGRMAGIARTVVQYLMWAVAAWALFEGNISGWIKGLIK